MLNLVKYKNILLGLVFVVIGFIMLYEAYYADDGLIVVQGSNDIMLYPKILAYAWIAASIIFMFSERIPADWDNVRKSLPDLFGVVLSFVIYCLIFPFLGLPLSTFIFLVLICIVLRYRNPWKIIPAALAIAATAYFAFEIVLEVVMPQPFWLSL